MMCDGDTVATPLRPPAAPRMDSEDRRCELLLIL
jgi:hypothetical protein